MSSIDKYVRTEARKYNPNVEVEHVMGRLVGKVNGKVVFNLADRYGYLNDRERSIIQESMNRYEEERLEKERQERLRIEAEKKAALRRFEQSVASVKARIEQAHLSSIAAIDRSLDMLSLSQRLSTLSHFNLAPFIERKEELLDRLKTIKKDVQVEHQRRILNIDSSLKSAQDMTLASEVYSCEQNMLKSQQETVSLQLPTDEISGLLSELTTIEQALSQLTNIETELKKIEGSATVRSIIQTALEQITRQPISSKEDVEKLLNAIYDDLSKIKSIQFAEHTKKDFGAIDEILLNLENTIRTYSVQSTIEAQSFKDEIYVVANRAINVYTDLANSQYTTCDEKAIESAMDFARSAVLGAKDDRQTYERLLQIISDADSYRAKDSLLRAEYNTYSDMITELLSRGVDVSLETRFNAGDPQAQLRRLEEMIYQKDISDAASRTTVNYLTACEVMEEMGFEMVYYNMEDSLANEAIFAKKGYEGVVWQVIVSDNHIRRRMIGINATIEGRHVQTSRERVKEVSLVFDKQNEPIEFFKRMADKGAERPQLLGVVDALHDVDGEHSDSAIAENGYFDMEAEGIEKYISIVRSEAQIREQTKTATYARYGTVTENKSEKQRTKESTQTKERYQKKKK